jgi:hypothetical protein
MWGIWRYWGFDEPPSVLPRAKMKVTFLHPPAPPRPFCGDGDGAAEMASASALSKKAELRILPFFSPSV